MQRFDEDSVDLLIDNIGFCAANIIHPACGKDLAGRFHEELEENGRALGILRILLDGDAELFYADLLGNAQSRRRYLALCARERHRDPHGSCSRSGPFFDALAAQCPELAVEIAALSPATWDEDAEYEDDYCHARFFHRYVAGDAPPEELAAIVARFEVAVEGAPSARLDLCKALLAREQGAFDGAFEALLDERLAEIEREKKGRAEEELTVAIGTHVFVEGLGVLWVAARAGFKTRREYPLCPALARVPRRAPIPPDLFASI
jgi:hypothetical protein